MKINTEKKNLIIPLIFLCVIWVSSCTVKDVAVEDQWTIIKQWIDAWENIVTERQWQPNVDWVVGWEDDRQWPPSNMEWWAEDWTNQMWGWQMMWAPVEAINACENMNEWATCSFSWMQWTVSWVCETVEDIFACSPSDM